MKPSLRALLFSVFVFPGAGLWAIGKKRRALIFIAPTLIAVILLISQIIKITHRIVEQMVMDTFTIDVIALYLQVRSQIYSDSSVHSTLWFLLIALIASGISSYFTGKKLEQEQAKR